MIEYLTKNGAPRCVGEFRDAIFKIRSFSDFFLVEGGSDKGAAIRDKTKQLVDLLTNEKLIEEERENSKKIRDRLAGNNYKYSKLLEAQLLLEAELAIIKAIVQIHIRMINTQATVGNLRLSQLLRIQQCLRRIETMRMNTVRH